MEFLEKLEILVNEDHLDLRGALVVRVDAVPRVSLDQMGLVFLA